MGVFDTFADKPNQIRLEGQEITVRLKRNGDGTATVSWNIPPPSAGCANGVGAYDGIVITVDSKPANYIKTSPKNGKYYNGDATVDPDLHLGDKIDTAMVLGAFYHDRKTTSLTITDVKDRTPYYISAYAVDNVGRYHREGVHSYALPTGIEEGGTEDTYSYHDISLEPLGGISDFTKTGLDPSTSYSMLFEVNNKEYTITATGAQVPTFIDLVDYVTKEFARLDADYTADLPPFSGALYLKDEQELYKWDGFENERQPLIINPYGYPIPSGAYWFNGTDLHRFGSNQDFFVVPFIQAEKDPSTPDCSYMWFDGVDLWERRGNTWCKQCLITSTRNPALPPILTCDVYWFDTAEFYLNVWDEKLKKWKDATAIVSPVDPNSLTTGSFWYNETDGKVKRLVNDQWGTLPAVKYMEANAEGSIDSPKANQYWFDLSSSRFYRRNGTNTEWVEQVITLSPTDPLDRKSCQLWWNVDPDVDTLYKWDLLRLVWVEVAQFHQTATDPSSAPTLDDCTVWFNPDTGEYKKITDVTCSPLTVIESENDPAELPVGTVWRKMPDDVWFEYDGTEWVPFRPILSLLDPNSVIPGYYYYNPLNTTLFVFSDDLAWVQVQFSTSPVTPPEGFKWFVPSTSTLYVWTGGEWDETIGIAAAELKHPENMLQKRSVMRFFTRGVGCNQNIQFKSTANDLISSLSIPVIYHASVRGNSGISAGQTYQQLGVGDDGSPDERRKLHNDIRVMLGYSVVTVELTKEALDVCIDNALLELRKYAAVAYKRNYFFLDTRPNQQTYLLTNQCIGFNKIKEVHALHRMRAGFFRASAVGSDIHAYAALQSLYRMGTFDMLSYHLVSSYVEELETLFASKIMYQWYPDSRELKLYQIIYGNERLLVDASIERPEQELMTDSQTAIWIKKWAVAEAKILLSQIRGKFQSLPGPNGATTLNPQELITQGETEKQELRMQLEDMAMQDLTNVGLRAHMIVG